MENNESPELIEQQMLETRQALTEKVARLESTVVDTMQSATSAVQNTVETVKDTMDNVKSAVEETVSSVKASVAETFDISSHVREHPWAMVGGAAAIGLLTGLFAFGRRENGSSKASEEMTERIVPRPVAARFESPREETKPKEPGLLDQLLDRARGELRKIGEEALDKLTQSLHQTVEQNVPRLIEDVQSRLGLAMNDRCENGRQRVG